MFSRILASILTFILFSCSNGNLKLKKYLKTPPINIKKKFELEFEKRLKFNSKSSLVLLRPFVFKDRFLYGYQKGSSDKLQCFDLLTEKHVYTLNLQDSLLVGEGLSSFCVYSTDSIFFEISNFPEIVLVDSMGNTINSWVLNANKDYILASFLPNHNPGFNSKSGYLFTTMLPIGYFDKPGFETTPLQAAFDVRGNDIKFFYAPMEGVMKFKGDNYYPADISVPYITLVGEKSIITYPMDHFIYVYNCQDGSFVDKKPGCSSIVKEFPYPLSENEIQKPQEVWNYRIQTPFYEPLFYHSEAKLFTRVIHHPQQLKKANGILNNGSDRTASVIIMDEDLNIIGEHVFKNGTYPIHGGIPLSNGLLIYSKDSGIPNLIYKFKKL